MPRVIILGCGTGVGKTRVAVALTQALGARGVTAIGLKPIESGVDPLGEGVLSDAAALWAETASLGLRPPFIPGSLYSLRSPVSPHLAAREEGIEIRIAEVPPWVANIEASVTTCIGQERAPWTVVETAGGVFTPLSATDTNFDLALSLEPATWVLVAADSLGVLHDVSATSQAMRLRGRTADYVVLSVAREPDASTGRNAQELDRLGIASTTAVLRRDDDSGISALADRLLGPALPLEP